MRGKFIFLNAYIWKPLVVIQLLSHIRLFETLWTTAHPQASPSFTITWSLLKLMFIESVMLSNHLFLCCPLLLLTSIFPSIRVFSNDSTLPSRWPKCRSFSFSISPSNECSELISFRIDYSISLQFKGLTRVFSSTTIKNDQFFDAQPFYDPTLTSKDVYWKNHSFDYTDLCWQSNVSAFHSLGLSQLSFQGTSILTSWLQSRSAVIWSPRKENLSLFPLFPLLFAMKWWDQTPLS